MRSLDYIYEDHNRSSAVGTPPLQTDEQVLDDRQELISDTSVQTQDAI